MILYYNCNPWSFKSVLNMNSYELYVNFFVKFKEFLIICQRNFMVYTCFNETDQSFLTNNLHNYTSLKFKRRIDGWTKYLQCADKIFVDIKKYTYWYLLLCPMFTLTNSLYKNLTVLENLNNYLLTIINSVIYKTLFVKLAH